MKSFFFLGRVGEGGSRAELALQKNHESKIFLAIQNINKLTKCQINKLTELGYQFIFAIDVTRTILPI